MIIKIIIHIVCIWSVFVFSVPSAHAKINNFRADDIGSPISSSILKLVNINKPVNRKQLFKTYTHILKINRVLGTGFSINIPLHTLDTTSYSITGFRQADKNWHNLTAGYSLGLIAQEIERGDSHFLPANIDLLIKDKNTGIYHPILDVSTSLYCKLLLSK